jgi:hypothetical protein
MIDLLQQNYSKLKAIEEFSFKHMLSSSAAKDLVDNLVAEQNNTYLSKIYNHLIDNNILVITYDRDLISRTITYFLGLIVRGPMVLGFHSPEDKKIYLLLDNNYIVSKHTNQHINKRIIQTLIHETVHYFATVKPKEFCKQFDTIIQRFFKLVFSNIDPRLEYYKIADSYYDLLYNSRKQIFTKSYYQTWFDTFINYGSDEVLNAFVKDSQYDKAFNYMIKHPVYLKIVATLYVANGKREAIPYSFFADMYNAYVKLTGQLTINLYYQELFYPDEVICVLSEADKKRDNILQKLLHLI